MAPCIDNGLLTLATCKPVIRRCAREGDWVVAFFGVNDGFGEVAWAGCIATKMSTGEYQRRHSSRADAVYREITPGNYEPLRPDYHDDEAQRKRDYSNPVLLFSRDSTWYFGQNSCSTPPAIQHLVASGQGHRVNKRKDGDLGHLISWLRSICPPGMHGKPKHDYRCGKCEPQPKKRKCVAC